MQRDDIFLASPSLASQSLLHPVPGCRVGTTSGVSFPESHHVPPHRGLEFGMAPGLGGSIQQWRWEGVISPSPEPQKSPCQCPGGLGTHGSRGARDGLYQMFLNEEFLDLISDGRGGVEAK